MGNSAPGRMRVVVVTHTPAEKDRLQQAAARRGLPLSEFLLQAGLAQARALLEPVTAGRPAGVGDLMGDLDKRIGRLVSDLGALSARVHVLGDALGVDPGEGDP